MSINPPTDFIQEKENMCYPKQKCSTGKGCCFKACPMSSLTQGMEKDMDQGCDMQGTPTERPQITQEHYCFCLSNGCRFFLLSQPV